MRPCADSLHGRRRDPAAERVLFALVANRASAPSSKLAASRWVAEDVQIPGLADTSDDACYRAMDFLLEIAPALESEVFHDVAKPPQPRGRPPVLRHHLHLLLLRRGRRAGGAGRARPCRSTLTATLAVRRAGFRTYGKSKDHRDDLPQIVVGLAVTREGIPVRVWSWPGNTADSPSSAR